MRPCPRTGLFGYTCLIRFSLAHVEGSSVECEQYNIVVAHALLLDYLKRR